MPRWHPPSPRRAVAASAVILLLLPIALAGCVPVAAAGTLPPTLSLARVGGVPVALQDGIAVPSFGVQPRPRIDLRSWRVQPATFSAQTSLTDRATSLATITRNAGGRQSAQYEDVAWRSVTVPYAVNPPRSKTGPTGARPAWPIRTRARSCVRAMPPHGRRAGQPGAA